MQSQNHVRKGRSLHRSYIAQYSILCLCLASLDVTFVSTKKDITAAASESDILCQMRAKNKQCCRRYHKILYNTDKIQTAHVHLETLENSTEQSEEFDEARCTEMGGIQDSLCKVLLLLLYL